MLKLSILIPVFNEKRTIVEIIEKVRNAALPTDWEKEIIVVDDGSTDSTSEILQKIEGIKLISSHKNLGKGGALKLAMREAAGNYIVIQDADLEYNPDDYTKLLRPIIDGKAKIVFGSRVMGKNNVPFSKPYYYAGLAISKIFNLSFGLKLTDVATCYKVFPKNVIEVLLTMPANDFVYDIIEMTYILNQHAPITETSITYHPRDFNEGKKINYKHGFKCLFRIFQLRLSMDKLSRKLRYKKVEEYFERNKPCGVMVDVGCGVTFDYIHTNKKRFEFCYGLDKKAPAINDAKSKIIKCDIDNEAIPEIMPNSVNYIVMTAVLEHLNNPDLVLSKLHDLLAPGGKILITTPTVPSKPVLEFLAFKLGIIDPLEIADHKHYFSKKELLSVFKNVGFNKINHRYFEYGFNHFVQAQK